MKNVVRVILLTATLAGGATTHHAAADSNQIDWSQFQIEPEPSPLLTLGENLAAHLTRADRSLTMLRSEGTTSEKAIAKKESEPHPYSDRLKNAYQFVTSSLSNPELPSYLGAIDELIQQLKDAEQIALTVNEGKKLSPEMAQALRVAHGYVKMARRQLPHHHPANPLDGAEPPSVTQPARNFCKKPAMIVTSPVDVPPAYAYVAYPLRNTLLQLSMHSTEQRQQYIRRIVEDKDTRLLEVIAEPEFNPKSPSYLLLVSKEVALPSGDVQTVRLPFRLTVEQVATEGLANVLRILTNTATDSGVNIRTRLLTEVPVTSDFSLTAYETCMSYAPSPIAEHRDKTVVSFAARTELTFYKHVSRGLRDVNFRSVVASKCRSALEQNKQQTALRAREELTHQIAQSIESFGVSPTSILPIPSAGGR